MRAIVLGAALALATLAACSLDDKDDPRDPPEPRDDAAIPDGAIVLDAPTIATDVDPFCAACVPGTMCVQFFDGTCGALRLECQPRNVGCLANLCSPDCTRWQCNGGSETTVFRCDVGECPGQVPGALYCYGP